MEAITCRILTEPHERTQAHSLVQSLYQQSGYVKAGEESPIAKHVERAGGAVFGASIEGVLFGTISVVIDTKEGLPMDDIYADELRAFRIQRKKLAEVGQFAIDQRRYRELAPKGALFAAAPLFAAVLSYAIETDVDYLCISINPKHDMFYETLGFEKIGDTKQYASVGALAIGRALHVPSWKSVLPQGVIGQQIVRHLSVRNQVAEV